MGGAAYAYDANDNLTSGGVTKTYSYNADSARVKKVRGTVSTYYMGGLWEEDSTGAVRKYYRLAARPWPCAR